MAFNSMTGFGRGAAATSEYRVDVELSSVNRKQLDVQANLPRPFGVLEARVFERVSRALSRGRVTVDVGIRRTAEKRAKGVRVDTALAAAFVRELRKTASALKLKDDLQASLLLNLPDVVSYEQAEGEVERGWPVIQKALDEALEGLVQMRAREGRALQKDLRQRLGLLKKLLASIRAHAPSVVSLHRKNLLARLQQAGLAVEAPDDKLLRELALFADRCDISEEITRLNSHIGQAVELMASAEAVGRALDFLLQEMLREINTIGSKGNDATILRHVVEFKAELERIREQVQNIE